jgi:hypothetical protein
MSFQYYIDSFIYSSPCLYSPPFKQQNGDGDIVPLEPTHSLPLIFRILNVQYVQYMSCVYSTDHPPRIAYEFLFKHFSHVVTTERIYSLLACRWRSLSATYRLIHFHFCLMSLIISAPIYVAFVLSSSRDSLQSY